MSEFNFKSQVCTTKEQSERLLALGLKKDTADMGYLFCGNKYAEYPLHEIYEPNWGKDIPAWSLHRLIKMLPCVVFSKPYALHLTILSDSVFYCTEDNDEAYEKSFSIHNNLYDNLIDCAGWLVRNGYVDKGLLNG